MTLHVEIPGAEPLSLRYLLLDVNGTLTDRGTLLPGVAERIGGLRRTLDVRLLSSDTYGTLPDLTDQLGVAGQRVGDGEQKAAIARELGASACAAIGNGVNDEALLRTVGLGIAVHGPEGTSTRSLLAADIVCPSILVALDLLTDSRALAATLRR